MIAAQFENYPIMGKVMQDANKWRIAIKRRREKCESKVVINGYKSRLARAERDPNRPRSDLFIRKKLTNKRSKWQCKLQFRDTSYQIPVIF